MNFQDEIKEKMAVEFWLSRLGHYQALPIASARIGHAVTGRQTRWEMPLPHTIIEKIHRLFTGEDPGTGCFLFYQLAYKLLIKIYSSSSDVVLACAAPGADLLFLRSRLDETLSVKQLLLQEQREWIAARRSARFDYASFIKKYTLNGLGSEKDLLQLGFCYSHDGAPAIPPAGTEWSMTITGSRLVLSYPPEIFHEEDAAGLVENYITVLDAMSDDLDAKAETLNFLSAHQKKLLYDFSQPEALFPIGDTVIQRFDTMAALMPDRIAVVFGAISLSFHDLRSRAEGLAWRLRQIHHVEAGDTVALMMDRSEHLVVATLGILWAGAVYVAIDPAYPKERQRFILEDSGAKVLLTAAADPIDDWKGIVEDLHDLLPAGGRLPVHRAHPSEAAFIIYTSGSTGKPKGILQTQRCLMNVVMRQVDHGGFEKELRVLQYSSVGFDVFIAHELFFSLLSGGTLYLVTEEQRKDLSLLGKYILENAIQWLLLPVSAWNTIVEVSDDLWDQRLALRHIVSAGEQLHLNGTLIRWLQERPGIRLHNFYGPSETHNASNYTVPVGAHLHTDQPIGRPAANTWIYILSDKGRTVPVGVTGEIFISGAGVAIGYVHQSGEGKFSPDPWIPGERMYRTGDLGRWLPDGNIIFLGRKDDMVKIRGQRVELGEIEQNIMAFTGVSQCAVIAWPGGQGQELAAYIRGQQRLDLTLLRRQLQVQLPDYMIPSFFIQLDQLPLNANGKVDKKNLPPPGRPGGEKELVAPRTRTEEQLVEIWRQVLGVAEIGVTDNFFELGGHSLKATRLASQLYRQLEVKITLKELLTCVTPEAQARLIDGQRKTSYIPIPSAPGQDHYLLSSSQRRLWLLSRLEQANSAYNIPGLFHLEGQLALPALDRAFTALIGRHEILRTVIREDEDGEPAQFIQSSGPSFMIIGYTDGRDKTPEELEKRIGLFIRMPFDLAKGPLLRVQLLQTDEKKWLLCFVMHHIIGDAWSLDLMFAELIRHYTMELDRKLPAPNPLRIHYKDYALWQQTRLREGAMEDHRKYWLRQFEGELPLLTLPSDHPRPLEKTYRGAVVTHEIPAVVHRQIKDICRKKDCTVFMGLLAAVNILLWRLTGQTEIIIGTPVAGREHVDLEDQIGFYLNTLPLRVSFTGEQSFKQLLEIVRKVTLDAYEHQDYPFDQLVAELPLRADRSRNPLFDVSVVWQERETGLLNELPDGLVVSPYEAGTGAADVSKFDLTIGFKEGSESFGIILEYNNDIYLESTAKRWVRHLGRLLEVIAGAPDRPLGELSVMDASEERRLLKIFNAPAPDQEKKLEEDLTVLDLFSKQAGHSPEATALVFAGKTMTYRELDQRSSQLAVYLQKTYAIRPDERIGLQLPRGEWLVPALLAVLKAGAAYVPIDPAYPRERIDHMTSQSRCRVVLDEAEMERFALSSHSFAGVEPSLSHALPLPDPSSLAYVIYTSGSTGLPKGCAITHRNLFNYIQWANEFYFAPGQRGNFGLFTSLSFDLTVTSIFCPLTRGAALSVFAQDTPLEEIFTECFSSVSGIDSIKLTPSHINLLGHLGLRSATMRFAILGGEAVTAAQVNSLKKINPSIKIYNEYGPTEATVGCVVQQLEPGAPILIGKPVAQARIYVLNEYLQLCPIGVSGELYIAGPGLAREYLDEPVLTAAKFIADPFVPGEKMYRTGDIGHWLPEGELVYTGRTDDQVKIRGHRIEPGDIENALSRFPGVDAVVVTASPKDEGDPELVAWLASREDLSGSRLRAYMLQLLPAYMIPDHFVRLDSLPLNANGKVDRQRLPDRHGRELETGLEYLAPRNELEEKLVSIWQEVLGREKIGIRDNFFELGGHSVKAAQLISRINAAFLVRINIQNIFREPTIETIAENIVFILEQNKQKQGRGNLVRVEI